MLNLWPFNRSGPVDVTAMAEEAEAKKSSPYDMPESLLAGTYPDLFLTGIGGDGPELPPQTCLLYTSPSPRDS